MPDAVGRVSADPVRPEVVHIKAFHPLDDHYGLGCLGAAAGTVAIHNAAARWSKALLDNAARPSGALVYDPGDGSALSGEQFDRLRGELEAVNGPTLTIEGRDTAGVSRAWYVRLWNYATGTPEDAVVSIDFADLDGGFLLPGEADPVFAGDVDRMFVSLVPVGYSGADAALPGAQEAWVELTDLACDGPGSVIAIGDAVVPEHGLGIASGYDDSYNLSPARLLRNALHLGYRGSIVHYVGMSHYFRLDGGDHVGLTGGALNVACAAWHRDFAVRAAALGYDVIWSLSYELFDAHCPEDWKQRAADGSPALTGWNWATPMR